MSNFAKVISLSYDSAVVTKTSALKTYYRSVRLIRTLGVALPNKDSVYTNILLCGNCVDPTTRNLYVFYIDIFYKAAWIIEINIDSRVQTVVYYDKYNDIGFDPLHKIYNARVVYGRIIWTDNLNPIYQIDVVRAKRSYSLGIGYGQNEVMAEWTAITHYATGRIVSNGNNFYQALTYNSGVEPRIDSGLVWKKLCLIEDAYYSMNIRNFYFEPIPPKHPPEATYQSDDTRKINNLRQTLFQIAYRYVYMDWRKSTFSPASIVPVPQSEEETATGLANEQISLNNKLQIIFNSGGEEVRAIEVIGRSSQDTSKWFLIDTINKFDIQERSGEISASLTIVKITLSMGILLPVVISTSFPAPEGAVALGVGIMQPIVSNSYVSFTVTGMAWDAMGMGEAQGHATQVACKIGTTGSHALITTLPIWIVVLNSLNETLLDGDIIQDGDILTLYPIDVNTGVERTGTFVITDNLGNTATVTLVQHAPIPPPTVTVQQDPMDDSGMILTGMYGSGADGTPSISITFSPRHPLYAVGQSFTMAYSTTKNSIDSGSGTFTAINRQSNTVVLSLTDSAYSGDAVVVYLSGSLIV